MNTLDRAIARQYLFNVGALIVLLFAFVVTIDVAFNIDRFIDRADELMSGRDVSGLHRALLVGHLVWDLWWPKLLQLFNYLLGLCLVGAMGFTFTQMVRHREMVAIMAGGISLRRVARPVLIVAAGLLLVRAVNQEFVLSSPRIAPLLTRDHGDALEREFAAFEVRLAADAQRRIFLARRFDPEQGRMEGLDLWERDADGVATRHVRAAAARWRIDERGVGGWDLDSPVAQPVRLAAPGEARAPDNGGAPAPARIETDLDPKALLLRRYQAYTESLSWRQMSAMLAIPRIDPRLADRLERIRWGRVATALSTLLSLVISMPFFLLREPRNMLAQSLKCAPIGIGSLLGGVLGASAAVPGLPPGFSVFLPVLVLIPVAVATTSLVRT